MSIASDRPYRYADKAMQCPSRSSTTSPARPTTRRQVPGQGERHRLTDKVGSAVNDLRASAEKAINLDAIKTAVEPYIAQVKGYRSDRHRPRRGAGRPACRATRGSRKLVDAAAGHRRRRRDRAGARRQAGAGADRPRHQAGRRSPPPSRPPPKPAPPEGDQAAPPPSRPPQAGRPQGPGQAHQPRADARTTSATVPRSRSERGTVVCCVEYPDVWTPSTSSTSGPTTSSSTG